VFTSKNIVTLKNNRLSFKLLNRNFGYKSRTSVFLKKSNFVVFVETDENHFSIIPSTDRTFSARDGYVNMSVDASGVLKIMSVIVCVWHPWSNKTTQPARVIFARSFDSSKEVRRDDFQMTVSSFEELTGLSIGHNYVVVAGVRDVF
jgi:hypothetical protein